MVIEDRIVDTNKFFLLNIHHFLRYLFGRQILPMLIIFSLSFLLLPFSTLMFAFVNLIVMMMAYKLAFDVLVDTARGSMSSTLRQNYLVTNGVAVKVLVVALLIELALILIDLKGFGKNYKLSFMIFSTFITPAIFMSLALTNSLIVALNPYNLFKIIRTTFISYVFFVLFWFLTIQLHEVVINPLLFDEFPVFINGIVSLFVEYSLLVLNFQIMGYIIFQNREIFNVDGMGFDKVAHDEIVIHKVVTNPIYERIKNLLADDEAKQALSMIVELQTSGDNSSELQDLYKLAMRKKLYRPSSTDVANKIHHDLKQGKTKKAFDLMLEHLDLGKDFNEAEPEDIKPLIKYAVQSRKTTYLAGLVKDFHKKYPNHPDIVYNYFLYAKLLYDDRNSRNQSQKVLQKLIQNYPLDKMMPEVTSWLKGINLIENKKSYQ